MDLETNAALAALVVSLVALFIASLQFIQAIFGTAEGYKRCTTSIIGPWAGLRYRRFHFREFRFEVQFITPHFLIFSPDERDLLEERERKICGEAKSSGQHVHVLHKDVIVERLVNARGNLHSMNLLPHALRRCWCKHFDPWNAINKMEILHLSAHGLNEVQAEQAIHMADLALPKRISTIGSAQLGSNGRRQTVMRTPSGRVPDPAQEVKVSWNLFLRDICTVFEDRRPHSKPDNSTFNLTPQRDTIPLYESWNFARVNAAMIFRQWSWDMMPSEMTRPLATIAVGHLVILAVRLGMEWRMLNFESGMFADGHGYSLSGARTDKLGLVFRYTYTTAKRSVKTLIPSKATNKLICGMLPGCPVMVRGEFIMIDAERKSLLDLSRVLEPNHVLTQLGLPSTIRVKLLAGLNQSWTFPSIHNEIVPLLCAFLPMLGCDCVRHCAHCWIENRKSVFHLWEGRYMLHKLLAEAYRSNPDDPMLQESYEFLDTVRIDYPEDFYRKKDGRAIDKHKTDDRSGADRCEKLVTLCRTFHRASDADLSARGFAKADEQDRTQYQNLVAAHFQVAIKATLESYKTKIDVELPSCSIEDDTAAPELRNQLMDIIQSSHPARPLWVIYRMLDNVQGYVKYMQDSKYGVAQYMRQRQCTLEPKQIEAAWWMLMVRAIAWDLSTVEVSWGEPIPAMFYDNHSPVWIT